MDRNTVIVAITSMILGTVSFMAIIFGIVYARTRKNRAPDLMVSDRIEERLTRIEQAVDAVAVEVERISEGQRFTTKLLSEKQKERLGA